MIKDTAIIICNYNKKDYILNCISSVLKQTYQGFDVYVVDNASTDGSAEAIENEFHNKIILIKNQENLGGSGGFNTGMRKALQHDYKYLLLLDNDVQLAEDAVEILYHTMEKAPNIGFQGCKILKMDHPEFIQEFAARVDYENMVVDLRHAGEKDSNNLLDLEDCDSVPACALLVRTDIVKQIGLMPEDNFVSWDDIEWCVRCIRAGYRVVANGNARVWHKGSVNVATNTFGVYYAYRNKIEFFMKYMQTENTGQPVDEAVIENRAHKILDDVFRAVYACNYTKRYNRVKTIMDALMDALILKKGPAENYQIRENDITADKFNTLLEQTDSISIDVNGCPDETKKVLSKITQYCMDNQKEISVALYSSIPVSETQLLGYPVASAPGQVPQKGGAQLKVCSHIFNVDNDTFETILIDGWCNLILNEKELLTCKMYNENYQLFKLYFEDKIKNQIRKNFK